MINRYINQLQDSDPNVRREAIIALGKAKDPAALKPLAWLVKSDPDPELRELGRKAGQYIHQQTKSQTRPQPPKEAQQPFSAVPFREGETDYTLEDPSQPPATVRFQQLYEEEVIKPQRRKRIYRSLDDDGDEDEAEAQPAAPPTPSEPANAKQIIERGREYNVSKDNQNRAKHYVDAALTAGVDGDLAKAMKFLTEALSLNPNLINDGYFTNIAATVTGLDGDEAAQMIIDRNQRRSFTENAEREQKNRRVAQQMDTALQSTWADFWFELTIYALIVIIGPVLAALVSVESATRLVSSFADVSGDLPEALQDAQMMFENLSVGSLLPIGIVGGISGVVSLLLQTAIIHVIATKLLGGVGTWRHLIRVLLAFYNKWFPVLFFVTYIAIAVTFVSLFSPIALCFVIVLFVLSLYVSGKTSGKIGEAYGFGAAQGCVSLLVGGLVIVILNVVISYALSQTLGMALTPISGSP